ncbi:hypothetical protein WICMUC_001315 [Wickerhamomyces mucosus]|uniref:Uncharacterized protein n=1 Tax=Wickerhamomyces mucosus TaxID=1378264 RepID=A0A9P8PV17_9ASCO|nr:hypothetical protein WICMUC_001315 [Wickerhamomyces mucosus]
MSSLEQVILKSREILQQSGPQPALKYLKSFKQYKSQVEYFQTIGEIYLEKGELEKAYNNLSKALELDPKGIKGYGKFFYLGQIFGGIKGVELINQGLNLIYQKFEEISSQNSKEELDYSLVKDFNFGIFTQIEIWMTDLCMEEEAEFKCNELINKSLEIDETNPESWSLLTSIKISQNLPQEAKQTLIKSWEYFQLKKNQLQESQQRDEININHEIIELIQPLINLLRLSIELMEFQISLEISQFIKDFDEDNVDNLYLSGFAIYLKLKKPLYDLKYSSIEFNYENFEKFKLDLNQLEENDENLLYVKLMVEDFNKVLKISERDEESIDPDIIQQSKNLLNEINSDSLNQLQFENDEVNEDNWEDEIESD